MWKVPLLLLVLGRASLWFLAEGGKTRRLRLPAAAGRGEGALTCWNAWVWHLRLTGKAEGSSEFVRRSLGAPEGKAVAQQVPGPIERAAQGARRSP